VGKLIPFLPFDAIEDDLMPVTKGKMRVSEILIDVDEPGRIKIGMKDCEEDRRTSDSLPGFQRVAQRSVHLACE
jgi:hypothetical protein